MNKTASEGKDATREPVKGLVTARKCECCGHHEIGITNQTGEYISLKPGMMVEIIAPPMSNKDKPITIIADDHEPT